MHTSRADPGLAAACTCDATYRVAALPHPSLSRRADWCPIPLVSVATQATPNEVVPLMSDRAVDPTRRLDHRVDLPCPSYPVVDALKHSGIRTPSCELRTLPHSLDTKLKLRTHANTTTWRRVGVASAFVGGVVIAGDMALAGNEIAAVGLPGSGRGMAIPGFVDLQVNGYAGIDVLSANAGELLSMGESLLRDGVFAYQPTLTTAAPPAVRRTLRVISEARSSRTNGATIIGAHLEGPFLSPTRPGTHPIAHLRTPNVHLLDELLAEGNVSMVTLAPELSGAMELIEECRRREIIVSLGHSAASAFDAKCGFQRGASAVTHLFNAMEPFSGRNPGLAGAALVTPGIALQLIADKVHLSDESLLLAATAGPERWTLVSDAIAAARHGDGDTTLGEVTVRVQDGVARRADGTIAGSIGSLHEGFKRMIGLGQPLASVIDAVTSRPARLMGDHVNGSLHIGGLANFIVLDENYDIDRIIADGHEVARN